MSYLAPPPAPRTPLAIPRTRRPRLLWIPWFLGAMSCTIGQGIFTLFAKRHVGSIHDTFIPGHILWMTLMVLGGSILILSWIAWPRGIYAWSWPWLVLVGSLFLLVAIRTHHPINTYGWELFRDDYPLYAHSPWFLTVGVSGVLLTSLMHIGSLVYTRRKRRAQVLQRRRAQIQQHRRP